MKAKRSQRKMNKGGETQFLISKNAEHHGDARHQPLLFPIGEEGETDMKIEVESNGEDACVIQTPEQQDLDDAYESLLQYLIADIWRFYTAHIMHQGGGTSIIVVRKEKDKETWQKARKISYASLHGSSDILFVAGQDDGTEGMVARTRAASVSF